MNPSRAHGGGTAAIPQASWIAIRWRRGSAASSVCVSSMRMLKDFRGEQLMATEVDDAAAGDGVVDFYGGAGSGRG